MATQGQEFLRHCSRSTTVRSLTRLSSRSQGRLHSIRPFQTALHRGDGSPIGIWNHTHDHNITVRPFSDAATKTTQPPSSFEQEPSPPAVESGKVQENALEVLVDGYTPGEALLVLNLKRASINPIEIVGLSTAARPGYPRDAHIIGQALRVFKRSRDLLIEPEHASAAVDGMLRSMLPSSTATAEEKVNAALHVLDAFVDTASGLYFATPMTSMDKVLSLLLEGVQEQNLPLVDDEDDETTIDQDTTLKKRDIRKHLRQLRLVPTATPPKQSKTEGNENDLSSARVARTTLQVLELLIQRKDRPYRHMKKRAARKYVQQIKIHHGPTSETVATCAKIVQQLCGPTVAVTQVVQPCATARCPVPTHLVQELETAIKEAEEKEAAAEAEASSEDGVDQDGQEEEPSKEESVSPEEEDKKQD